MIPDSLMERHGSEIIFGTLCLMHLFLYTNGSLSFEYATLLLLTTIGVVLSAILSAINYQIDD